MNLCHPGLHLHYPPAGKHANDKKLAALSINHKLSRRTQQAAQGEFKVQKYNGQPVKAARGYSTMFAQWREFSACHHRVRDANSNKRFDPCGSALSSRDTLYDSR
jgi:hypothetical protein